MDKKLAKYRSAVRRAARVCRGCACCCLFTGKTGARCRSMPFG